LEKSFTVFGPVMRKGHYCLKKKGNHKIAVTEHHAVLNKKKKNWQNIMSHSVAVENIILNRNNLITRGKFKLPSTHTQKKRRLGVKLATHTTFSVRSKYKEAIK
jgi:uncharacterized membrane protein YGL010W